MPPLKVYPLLIVFLLCRTYSGFGQTDLQHLFNDCKVKGSITLYDYQKKSWIYSDSADARMPMQPASTFKIINLLIALETGVIKDEKEIVRWPGYTDTTRYGYRPDIYKDMSVEEAFKVSAGWVFIELAKRVGRTRYKHYLELCRYGNGNLSEQGADFWNFGPFTISPVNQVEFLVRVYEGKVPFSKKHIGVLKKAMLTETAPQYNIFAKTGWTRIAGDDIGWWVGYAERNKQVYFFATRILKKRSEPNPGFGNCRKNITKTALQQLRLIE